MKEIKAFIHAHRIGNVVAALEGTGYFDPGRAAGCYNLSVSAGQGLSKDADFRERHYSMAIGEAVFAEYKLELLCEDHRVAEIMELISDRARTDRAESGWIYVIDVSQAVPIVGKAT